MKSAHLIIFFFAFALSYSQSEIDISYIRKQAENINAGSKDYQTFLLNINQVPTAEGNEVVVYTKEPDEIKLIKETYFSETGKTVIWDYIEDKHPLFIFKEYFTYKLPITHKKFNAEDFSKTEERFYLKDDRIIKWMKDKKTVSDYPKNAATIENNMMEHVADLIARFGQQTTK